MRKFRSPWIYGFKHVYECMDRSITYERGNEQVLLLEIDLKQDDVIILTGCVVVY